MTKRITEKYLYNAALCYLKRFPSSIPHFRKIMKRKIDLSCRSFPDQDTKECQHLLEELVETLCRQGMLNDEVYLEGRVNSLRKRGHSTKSIQSKLMQKGLICDSIDGDDIEAAMIYIKKKRLLEKEPIKQMASLARAGFSYDIAKMALQRIKEIVINSQ